MKRLIRSTHTGAGVTAHRLLQGTFLPSPFGRFAAWRNSIEIFERPRLDRNLDLERARLELFSNGIACFVCDLDLLIVEAN